MERRKITVSRKVYNVDDYSVEDIYKNLKKEQSNFERAEPGVEDIRFTYRTHESCGDSYTEFFLEGKRLENDKEFQKRLDDEAKAFKYRKEQYENLKKEFEGK